MALVLKREAAKRDLVAQWVWYAENASIDVADRFLCATEQTLAFLLSQPASGAAVFVNNSEIGGVRRVPVSGGFERNPALLSSA